MPSDLIDLFASWFPDATPTWAPTAAFAMCLAALLIILAGLFPSVPERLAHIEFTEVWHGVRDSVFRRRRSTGGRHHGGPATALAEDSEAADHDDPASTVRLGA